MGRPRTRLLTLLALPALLASGCSEDPTYGLRDDLRTDDVSGEELATPRAYTNGC